MNSVSENTRQSYEQAWKQFVAWCNGLGLSYHIPISEENVVRFIAYLFHEGYAAASISQKTAALGFQHKIVGAVDPCSSQIVKQALTGVKNLRPPTFTRLPISIDILHRLVQKTDHILEDQFLAHAFKAMMVVAFYALLRVGEMTMSPKVANHCLLFSDVLVMKNAVHITFRTYKHCQGKSTTRVVFSVPNSSTCPVKRLVEYIHHRGNRHGPLFVKRNGKAFSRAEFLSLLGKVMKASGISQCGYNTHSFRIGGATYMALQGYSSEQIRNFGRWKSDAYKRYISVNNLS